VAHDWNRWSVLVDSGMTRAGRSLDPACVDLAIDPALIDPALDHAHARIRSLDRSIARSTCARLHAAVLLTLEMP